MIEDGTIPALVGPNVGTNLLPNHPSTAGINALTTKDDEGPDPVYLIIDAPIPRSFLAQHLTTMRYGYTWGSSDQEGDFFHEGSKEDSEKNSVKEERECERKIRVMSLRAPEETAQVTPVYNSLVS